jgi:hypothetical protein
LVFDWKHETSAFESLGGRIASNYSNAAKASDFNQKYLAQSVLGEFLGLV